MSWAQGFELNYGDLLDGVGISLGILVGVIKVAFPLTKKRCTTYTYIYIMMYMKHQTLIFLESTCICI